MVHSLSLFNGERPDPISGYTNLGNGYRAFSPYLKRFSRPDDWSPFGKGGVNPYAYCIGDPINRSDPSGHMSNGQWIGMSTALLAGLAISLLTDAAALPLVVSLITTLVSDTAIGAGCELITEKIDGQKTNWGQEAKSAGMSAVTSLIGFGLGNMKKLIGMSKT